jgi:hypothetical protein
MAAQDVVVTVQSANGGLVDLVFFDLLGNQTIYELTMRNPSIGAYVSPPGRAVEGITIQPSRKSAASLLAGGILIDANSTALQPIFTCPASVASDPVVGCIITSMVLRGATTSLTTVSVAAGWNASGNNVFATATHTELTGATLASPIAPTAGQVIGLPGNSFGIKNSIAQGGAGNVTVDLFGYLF